MVGGGCISCKKMLKMFESNHSTVMIVFTIVTFLSLISHGSAKNIPSRKEVSDEEPRYLLAKDETCAQDVHKLCKKVKKENNFAVFICLQEAAEKDSDEVSDECHGTLWHYKYNLTQTSEFDHAASRVCKESIAKIDECKTARKSPGFLLNCLIEHRYAVEDRKCQTFLMKMSSIVFSDYRLIKGFYDDCAADVKKLDCGQISKPEDEAQHEQDEVIGCLDARIDEVSKKCSKRLVRIAELQADDYHLDRPLFYACQDARERFCRDVKAGEGKVYKCLMSHATNDMMPEECAAKLQAREKLTQKDAKVDFALWKHCEADVMKYKCGEGGVTTHGMASHLLLCLQQKIAEGQQVNPSCVAEMRSFAMVIFENYNINPIVVAKCDREIHSYCKNLIGKRDNGDMMDCLMTIAAKNDSLSKQCFEAVSEVLKETGAGNNYKVDRALYQACEPIISSLCDGKEDTMVLGCLMDHAHNPKMPEECSTQVFHLQYFLSRDFRLDAGLYRDCHADAKDICNANDFNAESESKMPDNFVIACLYRNAIFQNGAKQVSPVCSQHIRRIMHQRATNIRLMPEIEHPCMADLGKHCIDKSQEGEEIDCLQTNYDALTEKCQAAIKQFTELESKDFDLDKHLVQKCAPMVAKFCQRELEDGDGENVLPCLIQHKNEIGMDHQCSSAVEHWQLLEMKDFNFSPALKDLCLRDIRKLCSKSKTKFDAVKCLSENIVKDYNEVTEQCRQQVKSELVAQSENIKLNPELYLACRQDIHQYCSQIPPGGAQLEECLRKNHKKLQSSKCKQLLFKQEEVEAKDPEIDYRLLHVCKPMIKKYCSSVIKSSDIMECLRRYTHDRDMSRDCIEVVTERQVEQAESFVLDKELARACDADVKMFCSHEFKRAENGDHGNIFGCLVNALMDKQKRLTRDCENVIRKREAEAAKELNLNPQFLLHCYDEAVKLCPVEPDEIIDCMKVNMPKIKSKACQDQVRKLIVEGIEDVHVDPHLEEQCARDIRTFCQDMPKKSGTVVLCLIDVHKANNLHLQPNCENFLTKRLTLYNNAKVDLAAFDSISAVLSAVSASPNRNSIYMTVLVILAILFLGGILFGRLTKRVRAEVKNR